MARILIRPDDRLHMLVWRAHPSAPDDPGWRAWMALNGIPTGFGVRFDTWREAMDFADRQARR